MSKIATFIFVRRYSLLDVPPSLHTLSMTKAVYFKQIQVIIRFLSTAGFLLVDQCQLYASQICYSIKPRYTETEIKLITLEYLFVHSVLVVSRMSSLAVCARLTVTMSCTGQVEHRMPWYKSARKKFHLNCACLVQKYLLIIISVNFSIYMWQFYLMITTF